MTRERTKPVDEAPPKDLLQDAPRTGGDVAQSPSVQIGLLVLLILLGLLALWVLWSLVSAA